MSVRGLIAIIVFAFLAGFLFSITTGCASKKKEECVWLCPDDNIPEHCYCSADEFKKIEKEIEREFEREVKGKPVPRVPKKSKRPAPPKKPRVGRG